MEGLEIVDERIRGPDNIISSVVLFSGGIDSLAALLYALEIERTGVLALYVDLGHRYADKEKKAFLDICENLGVNYRIVESKFVGQTEEESAHIPWRNLFLILAAAYQLETTNGRIYIQNVQVGEDTIGDRTLEFNREVAKFLNKVEDTKIAVISPFSSYTKSQIVRYVYERCGTSILKKTVSCFSSDGWRCGRCPACFRTWIALECCGIDAVSWFDNDPREWEGVRNYIRKMATSNMYDQRRVTETFAVLHKHGIIPGLILVDLDGVLTKGQVEWWRYGEAEPNYEVIDKINELYEKGYIVWIYTSRFRTDHSVTVDWLMKHDVRFHKIVYEKPWGTHYIDDRATDLDKLFTEIEVKE